MAIRTANCSGGLFLRLRAAALALRGPPLQLHRIPYLLMPDLGNHVVIVEIPARITLANEGLGIRVEPQRSRTHYPRLEQHIGILYRDFIAQSVSFPAQFLDDVHVVGMKISASIEPREIVEPDGVDDQRIAFPAADGIYITR